MDGPNVLPFKIGQFAESRSFKKGFRGAWFRCKIKSTFTRNYTLDFYDFSEEKERWTKLYQIPQKGMKPELMIRPQYPPIYNKSEVRDGSTMSEVTVVRNDEWKVGDKVDWFADGCYWSGSVTKILTDDTVQVYKPRKVRLETVVAGGIHAQNTLLLVFVLPPPPAGEGLIYEVSCKDLRPSLDWSLQHGWTVPISKGGENLHPCAWLIKPAYEVVPQTLEMNTVYGRGKGSQLLAGSSFGSSSSCDTSSSVPLYVDKKHEPQATMGSVIDGITRTSCSDSISTSQIRDTWARTYGDEEDNSSGPTKRMRTGSLNFTRSDTVEALVLDLEELVSKVKWLKGILKCGNLSKAKRPPWKVLAHGAYKRK